jgi:hypothetical protein
MSTNRSVGRFAATNEKDRSRLCAFTFVDGRQCRTPRRSGHPHLCYFHAQKEAESLAAKQAGEDISRFLPTKLLTACDLGVAMSRLFRAVASGEVKPKVAGTLAYLAQTMLQSIPIAQHEYCEALGTDYWRSAIRSSFNVTAPEPKPAPRPQPAPKPPASLASAPTAKPASSPAPQPPVNCHSACPDLVGERSAPSAFRKNLRNEEPASSSNSSLATHHPPLPPAPSPRTPLPPTSTEFAQQVLAGRNSSRSEIPTLSGPGREPGSSLSSSSSASSSTGSSTNQTQPKPASQTTSPQQSQPTHNPQHNSQPAPTPPAPPSAPPGFGAPANWDVLIPPKHRRRFSRHWQLLE